MKNERIVSPLIRIHHQCGKVTEGLVLHYDCPFHQKLREIHELEDCCNVEREEILFVTSEKRIVDGREAFQIKHKSLSTLPPVMWGKSTYGLELKTEEVNGIKLKG